MDRNFFLDVGDNGQNHRASGTMSGYVLFLHEGHISLALFLGAETQEHSTAELALGIGQMAKMEAGQIADSFIDATRIAAYRLHDGIELAGLSQQDPATELVQAVIRCDEPNPAWTGRALSHARAATPPGHGSERRVRKGWDHW